MLTVSAVDENSITTMDSDSLVLPTDGTTDIATTGMNTSTTTTTNDHHHGSGNDDDDLIIDEVSFTNSSEWRMVDVVNALTKDVHHHHHHHDDDDNHNHGHTHDGVEDSGVLILDGEEPEVAEVTLLEKSNNNNSNNNNTDGKNGTTTTGTGTTGLDLSLGVDSVPTDVGSIEDLNATVLAGNIGQQDALNANAAVVDGSSSNGKNEEGEKISTVKTTDMMMDLMMMTGSTPNVGTEKVDKNIPTAPIPEGTASAYNHHNKSRLALFLVPTVALFLMPAIASVHLYRERNSLMYERDCILTENNYISNERDALTNTVARLEGEIQSLKDKDKKKRKEWILRWNEDIKKQQKETVLIDNCWLSASANVQLRNCAIDAKERAKEKATAIAATLLGGWEQLGNTTLLHSLPYNNGMDDVGESVAEIMRKVDLLGKKLWNTTSTIKGYAATTETGNERKDTNGSSSSSGSSSTTDGWKFYETPSFFSRMETSGRAQWKHTVDDVKSVFSTFFSPVDVRDASESYQQSTTRASENTRSEADALDDVVDSITDIVAAAGTFSAAAGEAVAAAAVEKASSLLMFNGSYLDELLEIATEAAREASLTHAADK